MLLDKKISYFLLDYSIVLKNNIFYTRDDLIVAYGNDNLHKIVDKYKDDRHDMGERNDHIYVHFVRCQHCIGSQNKNNIDVLFLF